MQQPMSVKSTVHLSIHGGQFWFLDHSKNKLITWFYPKQSASATPTLEGYLGNRSLSIRSFSFKRKIQMIPKLKLIMWSFVRTCHCGGVRYMRTENSHWQSSHWLLKTAACAQQEKRNTTSLLGSGGTCWNALLECTWFTFDTLHRRSHQQQTQAFISFLCMNNIT